MSRGPLSRGAVLYPMREAALQASISGVGRYIADCDDDHLLLPDWNRQTLASCGAELILKTVKSSS